MKREIKVGLTLMAGLVLAYLVVAWVNRSSLFAPPEKQYFLSFQQVNGLLEGDPVVVRGFQAGRVVAIVPAADAVSVEIALDERIALFADGYAEIQIKELMGGKQIALMTGTQGSPLASGATLAGRTSLDFSTAFSRFGGVMDQMDPNNIERLAQRFDSVATSWNAAIDPATLGQILNNIERITARLDRQSAQIPVKELSAEAENTLDEVQTLLSQTNNLVGRIDSLSARLEAKMLSQGEQLLEDASQSLERVNSLVSEAEELIQKLENPETFAGKALNDPAFAARVDSTLWHLNRTLGQIHDQKVIVGFRRKQ